eukprot:2785486-Pyramimonas_sp.AAC.1
MGRFWAAKGIKFVIERSMLQGSLLNAAQCGLEVLVKGAEPLASSDLSVLESFIARNGCAILGGAAEWTEEADHVVTCSAHDTLREFR